MKLIVDPDSGHSFITICLNANGWFWAVSRQSACWFEKSDADVLPEKLGGSSRQQFGRYAIHSEHLKRAIGSCAYLAIIPDWFRGMKTAGH
jgi:hypothetical protein